MVTRSTRGAYKCTREKISQKSFQLANKKFKLLTKALSIAFVFGVFVNINLLKAQTFEVACPTTMNVACAVDIPTFTVADLTVVTNPCSTPGLNAGSFIMNPPFLAEGTNGNCNGDMWSVFLSVQNNCGETAGCSVRIGIANGGPTIACPTLAPISACDYAAFTPPPAVVTLPCGGTDTANGTLGADPGCGGNVTITYSYTDVCGATVSIPCVLTVTPSGPSAITCPAIAPISACSVASFTPPAAVVNLGCGGTTTVAGVASAYTGGCAGGTINVTYTFTNACETVTQVCPVTVTPEPSPTITCPAIAAINACDVAAFTPPVAVVNLGCGGTINVAGVASAYTGGCAGGTINVTYTYANACETITQICPVTVTPEPSPTITCPTIAAISACNAATFTPPVAVVNLGCGGTANVAGVASAYTGGCAGGIINVTYTFTNDCGTVTQICPVTVTPEPSPTITCPTIAPISACSASTFTPPVAIVNLGCGGTENVAGVASAYTGGCAGGTINVTYTFTNACGTVTQVCPVTVNAEPSPTITCPTIAAINACDAATFVAPVAVVNLGCGGIVNVAGVASAYTGGCAGGIINVTYTYVNACETITQVCPVTVTPEPSPTITCPTIAAISACNAATFTPPVAVVNLGCGGTINVAGVASAYTGGCAGGIINVTYTYTNTCGTITQICPVTVTAEPRPTIVCPTLPSISACNVATFTPPTATVNLGCGGTGVATATVGAYTGGCAGGTINVTYSFTDACGTVTQVCPVTVNPEPRPTIVCPTLAAISACSVAGYIPPQAVVNLGCGGTVNVSGTVGTYTAGCASGTLDVSYSFADACGPVNIVCQVVVNAEPRPTIVCPTLAAISACSVAGYTPPLAVVNLGCGGTATATGTVGTYSGGCAGGTVAITYAYTDACGPVTETCLLTVNPEPRPTITCPILPAINACDVGTYIPPNAVVNLGCGGTGIASGVAGAYTGGCTGGTLNVTYTYSDACGPVTATCVVQVTAEPRPTIACPTIAPINACNVTSYIPPQAIVTLGCGGTTVANGVLDTYTAGCAGGVVNITYSYTDACGTVTQVCPVVVNPEPRPTITCPVLSSISACDVNTYSPPQALVSLGCGTTVNVAGVMDVYTGGCAGGTMNINYTYTDACGTITQTCTLVVLPEPRPTITCPTIPAVDLCNIATFTAPQAEVSLGCGGTVNVPGVMSPYTGPCTGGTMNVTYTYTDACGPITITCPVTVNAAPASTITCTIPPGFSINACSVAAYTPPLATVNIGCGGTTTIAGTKEPYTDGCGGGTLNITYTYNDGCALVTKVCVVIVTPEPAATITCPTIPVVSTCNMFSFTPPAAIVNLGCGGTDTTPGTVGPFMGDCSGGTVIVTYEYTNDCGVVSEPCSVTVSGDTTGPTLTCPDGLTNLQCGDIIPAAGSLATWGGTITDNCSSTFRNFSSADLPSLSTLTPCVNGTTNIIRTYSVEDDCGNVGTCTQTFSFTPDTTPPAIGSCDRVVDIVIQCGAADMVDQIDAWLALGTRVIRIGTTDNCTNPGNIVYGNDYAGVVPAFNCGLGNGLAVNFFAEDECMNRSACTASIFVTDTEAPKAICPPEITGLSCDDDVPAPATTMQEFLDIGGMPGMVMTGSGTMTMTGSGTMPMTGSGTTPMTGSGTFDNCAPEVWVLSQDDKTKDDLTFCAKDGVQKITRTYYLTDDCGNTTSCTQDIIFNPDETPPVVTCPDLQLVADPHVCYIDIVLPDPMATDGCSGVKKFENSHIGTQYLVGDTTVTWTVTDSCHNESTCVQKITVLDQQSPSIACSTDTLCLSLDVLGNLIIPVESLYDDITDNCHLLKPAMVQKLDGISAPAPQLNFDCSMLGDTCMVQVIASDQYDNTNACMRTIIIKDEVPPYIVCPPARTVNCEFPLNLGDLSNLGGIVEVTDACGVETTNELTPEDTGFECMTGGGVVRTVTRTFEAIDSSGNRSTCTQVISIIDEDPFAEEDIMWLDDVEVACMGATSVDSIGQPGIMSDACSQILFDHTDMTFDLASDACRRIMRIWKVIDWCQYDRVTGAGEWIDTQYIDIVSTVPPTFNETYPDRELCAQSCDGGRFQMSFSGTSGCADFGVFGYIYNIRLEDGRVIQSTGNNIDQMLPLGNHTVTLTVKDDCHQISTTSFMLTVKDCKPPAIVCINGLVVNLMDTNPPMVPLWASDFSQGTKDNCTPEDQIVYSFEQDTAVTQQIFTCGQHDRNLGVTIYAMDAHGNQSSCRTTLMVQTNGVSCAGFLDQGETTAEEENTNEEEEETAEENTQTTGDETAMISGLIRNHKGEGIMNTEVNIQSGPMDEYKMTSNEGGYAFESLEMYKNYMIKPSKNDDMLNGVSTLDLVLIQKHVLGISVIEDPYLRIAADIDGSKRISARDLVELRKLILGSQETFSNNESWRFVDANYEMDQNDAWNFPEEIEYYDLESNQMSTDFVGIKIGDINGNSKTQLNSNNVEPRSSEKMQLSFENTYFDKGDNLIVSMKSGKDIDLNGLQLALATNEELELVDVISGKMKLTNEHYRIERNSLLISWNQEEVESLGEGDELFSLAFRAKDNGNVTDAIKIKSDRLTSEVYDGELNIQDIVLDDKVSSIEEGFVMHQNKPNPFIAATEIEFVLPKAMEASIIIYDVNGQLLMKKSDNYAKGTNRVMITKDQLGISSGVIFYRLEAGGFTDVKTMLLIE